MKKHELTNMLNFFGFFLQFWQCLKKFYNLKFRTFFGHFGNFWQFLTILTIHDNFDNLTRVTFLTFFTVLPILANFGKCWIFWQFLKILDKDQYKDINKNNSKNMWNLRHWWKFWLRTWFHDNLCNLTFKSDTGWKTFAILAMFYILYVSVGYVSEAWQL